MSRPEPHEAAQRVLDREPPELEPLIQLRGVGVSYRRAQRRLWPPGRRFWALRDVSFDVHAGEALGVVGRNGVGKSTLLRVLGGILGPDRGTIRAPGVRATLLSLQVGFARHLSGRENAILSGMLLGLTRRQILERMDAIIEFSELGDFIDQPIATYSSGMTARLGFSTAFQIDPDVLLIDEVLGVGDAAFVEKSSEVLREKIRSNKTVVLVSHSAAKLRELCDRAVWIHDGVSRAEGKTDEVIRAYTEFLKTDRPTAAPPPAKPGGSP